MIIGIAGQVNGNITKQILEANLLEIEIKE